VTFFLFGASIEVDNDDDDDGSTPAADRASTCMSHLTLFDLPNPAKLK
jgi:hypothetical protein